ncbi:hypothetical protein G6F63_016206 [Rhizopus arrhizus]|nr:hypothetical protein G6F40_015776 [Rhizopus arrhizus]KAG1313543.1 hypothetical protein G6F63_016206 [Rhizopus arrhizus]
MAGRRAADPVGGRGLRAGPGPAAQCGERLEGQQAARQFAVAGGAGAGRAAHGGPERQGIPQPRVGHETGHDVGRAIRTGAQLRLAHRIHDGARRPARRQGRAGRPAVPARRGRSPISDAGFVGLAA